LLKGHARDTNDLPAAGLAGRYGNRGLRNLQKVGKEFDTGLVGSSFRRWGGQGQFQCVPQFPRKRVLPGAWMNLDREGGARGRVLNGDHSNRLTTEGAQNQGNVKHKFFRLVAVILDALCG